MTISKISKIYDEISGYSLSDLNLSRDTQKAPDGTKAN